MQASERAAQARRALDRTFRSANLEPLRTRPPRGWIRVIRSALGMSQATLAGRLGVTPAAVTKLEKAEPVGAITVAKLAEVAAALDCQLVYAIVPNTSLADTVLRQARLVAATQLGYVSTTMSLEDQSVSAERRTELLDAYTRDLADRGNVWKPG